jgi:hypothetical protein
MDMASSCLIPPPRNLHQQQQCRQLLLMRSTPPEYGLYDFFFLSGEPTSFATTGNHLGATTVWPTGSQSQTHVFNWPSIFCTCQIPSSELYPISHPSVFHPHQPMKSLHPSPQPTSMLSTSPYSNPTAPGFLLTSLPTSTTLSLPTFATTSSSQSVPASWHSSVRRQRPRLRYVPSPSSPSSTLL